MIGVPNYCTFHTYQTIALQAFKVHWSFKTYFYLCTDVKSRIGE
jgi:hypothetical protein